MSDLILNQFNKLFKTSFAKRKIILPAKKWQPAVVINRPSKIIKSPYLADVKFKGKKY